MQRSPTATPTRSSADRRHSMTSGCDGRSTTRSTGPRWPGCSARTPTPPASFSPLHQRIQTLLSAHAQPEPGPDLERTRPRHREAPDRRLWNARHADHDLERTGLPDRLHHRGTVPRFTARQARLPRTGQSIRRQRPGVLPLWRLANEMSARIHHLGPELPCRVGVHPIPSQLPELLAALDGQLQLVRVLQPPTRRHHPRRARGGEHQRADCRRPLGASRQTNHRPGAVRAARHPEHHRLRLPTHWQLPIQRPAGRAARPTLGALVVTPLTLNTAAEARDRGSRTRPCSRRVVPTRLMSFRTGCLADRSAVC